ncbi:type IV pilus biogenesis protein PilM [Sutcliffiella sp. NC1]|uniref:type IV pilus biogenesis protein PilM n=1 Tax=Sutcliffiella sp. NC1 TaxID=3004096 RepID=UPI0022DE5342|nr:pilus assembly protein PilM [Sutcliffiella sp. NC1]WBL13993.1 pilus assembly protein PilM [Sutcliffiella sp. NC1]
MDLSFLPSKNNYINLIIRDHCIRLVELKSTNPLQIKKYHERFLPPNIIKDGKIEDVTTLKIILEQCVDEWGLKRKQVRFVVPDSVLVTRKLSIPADIMDDEIIGYLYLELGSTIHLPFEDPVFDVHVLNRSEKTDIILFAVPEEVVASYSSLLEDVKLKPVTADISPLSLYRLYYENGQRNEHEHLLVVHFDVTGITLSIFVRHVPMLVRTVALTPDLKHWEVSEGNSRLQWSGDIVQFNLFVEDFITEVERVMGFFQYSMHQGNERVQKILLYGDHPNLPLVTTKLKEKLEVKIDTIEQAIETINGDTLPNSYYLALGLALKEGR